MSIDEIIDSQGIYDIRVTLRKSFDGKKTVRVYLRRSKRGKVVKIDFPFPKDIDEKYLHWKNAEVREEVSQIISYNRRGKLEYYDSKNHKIPIDMAQRLEPSVLEALKQNSDTEK